MALTSVHDWLDEYGRSHRDPVNKAVHWICVPLIAWSVIGLLWALPVPAAFARISPVMNWGMLFMMAAIVYYFILSTSLAFGMVLVIAAFAGVLLWLDGLAMPLWQISLAVFIVAWVGQFMGHAVEGRRPSFFRDLQFLMIGPLWLLSSVYRKLGIPY